MGREGSRGASRPEFANEVPGDRQNSLLAVCLSCVSASLPLLYMFPLDVSVSLSVCLSPLVSLSLCPALVFPPIPLSACLMFFPLHFCLNGLS